ncbi:ABC transporter permease [Anaeropeptidivorans aminofermentans]|jgi:spermidine/putrescine transport system permease protein|uniref:ABC transporter permease n=1 Tax=Anaeropeptidivorans aminofermentans TaxID=2934315 RepID=UPI002025707E|nr:ABC transporter permease [Anaeropeptidivorans aminofermentans]MBE6013019.1 ABC transporter permease [Lachnospiraceae bacterium]
MRNLKKFYLGLMLLFMYAPIVVLIAFSFNESRSRGYWGGFTLDWYIELFHDKRIMKALYNTVVIALLSSAIATVIGTIASIGINGLSKASRNVVMNITNLPVLNPDIVTGVSLMILYISVFKILGLGQLGFMTLLISHVTFNIPYVILSVLPKLRQLDKNLYEAALDLGASPLFAFFKVVLPEIMPGIVTGAIFAFTLSIDDFVISFFTTGSGVSNLSVIVYSMARRGVNPKINALSTLMFVAVLALLYLINKRDASKLKES